GGANHALGEHRLLLEMRAEPSHRAGGAVVEVDAVVSGREHRRGATGARRGEGRRLAAQRDTAHPPGPPADHLDEEHPVIEHRRRGDRMARAMQHPRGPVPERGPRGGAPRGAFEPGEAMPRRDEPLWLSLEGTEGARLSAALGHGTNGAIVP